MDGSPAGDGDDDRGFPVDNVGDPGGLEAGGGDDGVARSSANTEGFTGSCSASWNGVGGRTETVSARRRADLLGGDVPATEKGGGRG